MSMEDGTLRKLELYLHDLHKKIDGIYDMLMLRHERETEQKGSSAINEKLLDNQDLCLLFQISPRSLQRYRSLGVLPYKRKEDWTSVRFSLHYFCLQFPCENLILLIKLLIIRKYHHPIV